MSELQKCYTNYVSIHRDEAHPREVVYWADAQKRIAELQARIQELGVKLRSRGLNIETLEARIAELEAEVERYKFMATSGVRTYDIQREAIAELEARLANAERYTP